jgi:hypothetical protein
MTDVQDFITMPYLYCRTCKMSIIEYDDEFSIESNDSREKFQLEQIYMKNIKICKNKCNCSFLEDNKTS